QLNQYKTSLATMDKQVEYSTISISLEEVRRYSQEVQEVTFAEQVSRAFTDAIESFTLFCQGIVLFAVRYFPYLIILLIIIVLIILAARRARAKRIAMMMDPEYAKAMNARQRARAEKIAQKQAQKEARKNVKNTAEGGKRVYKRFPAENEAGQEAVNPAAGADSGVSATEGTAAADTAEGTAAAGTAADKAAEAPEVPAGQVDSASPDRSDK
ncbi:MAG: DUF4349 domain-containing protein, partial [Eubacteriales bacterium]|nr:DUF4349 domain-containing protein [Eubacteriales bacterium]